MNNSALDYLYQNQQLKGIYDTRVRHYTIIRHTQLVCGQFNKYFSNVNLPISRDLFDTFLALHDIGKPEAYQKGNKDNQHIFTVKIINETNINWGNHLFSEHERNVLITLTSTDCIGLYFQGKSNAQKVVSEIQQLSEKCQIDKCDLFKLFMIYYQCDTGSYTKDAGGYPYLEKLFIYENGEKVFDEDEQLLRFSSFYQSKYVELKKALSGKVEKSIVPDNIIVKHENIFNSKMQTIVNTVNCVGVMGKGIALVFKLRYPKMFDIYKDYCNRKLISIGKLWLYKDETNAPWVLNFPTKFHWKYPSKIEYIEKGLQKFIETYKEKGITSIAFPMLGTHNGGLDKTEVLSLMTRYLSNCDIPIEIYDYDPNAKDDLFETFKTKWNSIPENEKKFVTAIRTQKQIDTITEAVNSDSVKSMIALIEYEGIGIKTMEKCFKLVMNNGTIHQTLF